ncbi:hypothetical protein ACTFIU_006254 [Dictyostelium citrinum]
MYKIIYLLISLSFLFKIVLSDLKVTGTDFRNRYSSDGSLCFNTKKVIFSHPDGIDSVNWISDDYTYQENYQINNTAVCSEFSIVNSIGEGVFHYVVTSKNPSLDPYVSQNFTIKCLAPKEFKFETISKFFYNFYKSTYSVYVNIIGLDENTDPPAIYTGDSEFSDIKISDEFGKYKLTLWGITDTFTPLLFFYSGIKGNNNTLQYNITSPYKNTISYKDSVIDRRSPADYQMINRFDYPQYWIKLKPQERYPYLFLTYSFFNPPKLVSSNDDGSYNYFINLRPAFPTSQYNPKLILQNFTNLFSIADSYEYNTYEIYPQNPSHDRILDNKNSFIPISCNGYNVTNRIEIKYRWNDDSYIPFPFGYGSGNNSEFLFDLTFITTKDIIGEGYSYSIEELGSNYYFTSNSSDKTGPEILEFYSYDTFSRDRNTVLFRLNYSTPNGILKIDLQSYDEYNSKIKKIRFTSTDFNIISGDLQNGVLEFLYFSSISENDYFLINVYDVNSNFITVQSNHYNYGFTLSLPPLFLNNYGFNAESISNISFLFNDVNLTDSYGYNIMYLETNDDIQLPFEPCLQIIPQWDNITIIGEWINSRYEFKFFMPPNIVPGAFEYSLKTPSLQYIFNTELPDEFQLNVISDRIDLMGPIVTEINKNPSNSIPLIENENYNISWTFTITDYNGFDKGYVVVIGSIDNILYNFTIVSPTEYSNEFTYQINITLNNNTCISQTYSIAEMVLYDKYGLNSTFFMNKGLDYTPNINPLYQIQDKSLFSIETVCPKAIGSFIQPELKSFDFEPKSIDVGSLNRYVTFTYGISIGSGIKEYPIVYLTSTTLEVLKCKDVITTPINSTFNEYKCTLTLPYGFGLPQDVLVNLYGLIGFGSYFGYSSMTLNNTGYPSSIKTGFTTLDSQSAGFITSTSSISTEGGSLFIYGRFPINGDFSIEFSKGYSLSPSKKSGSIIKVDGVKPSSDSFTISIKNGISKSNLYTVTPHKTEYFRPILTSKCKGTPICGGPNQGTCNNVLGCICNSPWVGVDCSSKVIILPQPVFNTSSPTIIVNDTTTSSNSETNLVAIISVVAIREIDFNNKVVHMYSFDKWIYNSINPTVSTYSSNIVNKNGSTTPISVNIEYFENEKTIEFAGQEIKMKPSSIKYTINIDQYPFSARLNQLQLIISATAITNSDSDSCSNKEFDNTTSESSDYIKLSISNKSLYGRFIRRALVDSKPITISNELLDQSLGAISDSHTSQSFIGINIPIYSKKVIIDPDFSLLLNSNPTTITNDNSICSPKSSSTGLSKAKLAGIIVGCSIFAIAITVATVVTIKRKRTLKKEMKVFSNKLEAMKQN